MIVRIIGATVKMIRQRDGGALSRKAPGYYSERATHIPLGDGDNFGDSVQQAVGDLKAQVCADIDLKPDAFLKPSY